MAKAVATLTWSAAQQSYVWSSAPRGEALFPLPESSAWFAGLAEFPSFAFHGQSGSFTARQERRERGERYWYAYLRTGQKVRKKYLGKTADLTLARLEQVARLLEAERAHEEPPAPATPAAQAALPDDLLTPLLATKLHVPRPSARLVPRSRLIERLSQGLTGPLILLCAPPGFGKTTLLAEFLAGCQLPIAWLSLDREDNDPLRFLTAVLAALQRCDPALGASVRPSLSSPRGLLGLSLPAVFTFLINEIASQESGDLLLVLDDYHLISNPEIHRTLGYLVDHCPENLHLVIATRADPPLPLARLRARGQVCELRAAELQFDADEARVFLRTALGRDPDASTLATIMTRTEGWAAGLQLTALSLQGRRSEVETRQFLADSAGSQRHLVDYLTEEVLAQQPEAVQAFLMRTSLLEPLCASLCAAVTGAESSDESAARLSSLERANLFLFPLDERGEWYRYHPLWASVLRVRLEQQVGAAGVADLYGRASRWYEQHDLPVEAIDAALAAGDFARAAQMLDELCTGLLLRGHYARVRGWVERLPPEQWRTRPLLCLAYAWALFLSGRLAAYQAPLEEAERLFAREEHAIGLGLAATLRALAAAMRGEGPEALAAGQEALALLPAAQLVARSLCMSALGTGSWLLGEVAAAWQTLTEARALHERVGNLGGLLSDQIVLGQVLGLQGKLHEAAAAYQQVIEQAAERRWYAIEAMIHLAGILYEWNACEQAEALLARALEEANETADHVLLVRAGLLTQASVTQARLRQARGEHEAARELLDQAVKQAEQSYRSRLLARAQAEQIRWWLVQGDLEAVRSFREARTERGEGAPTFQQERGALTLARVLIAEGEAAEALRLLDGYHTLAHEQGRLGSVLRIRLVCALAEARRGKMEPAVQHLGQALALAEPAGYVRLFLDEGPALAPLLRLVLARRPGKLRAHYVQQVLLLLSAEHPEQTGSIQGGLPMEALRISGREREVLRGLSEGLSTPQLAERLVVSPNTIKTQLQSLYRKLDARTREEALAQATRLHLL